MSLMTVLKVHNLKKRYGEREAVKGVSFTVEAGEIVGLLGPNGAGKTSTISMIMGVLEPSEGSVEIAGFDIIEQRAEALQQANFAAVYAQLPGNLTVQQNMNVFARLYGVFDRAHMAQVMRDMDVEKFAKMKVGLLSSGEQTRAAVAKAMLSSPKLLLLDEPTASLDPSSAQLMRRQMAAYVQTGAGILWTSHNMHEVTEVCDRVLFLSHGEILLEGNPKTLPQDHGKKDLEELFIAVAHEPLSFTE